MCDRNLMRSIQRWEYEGGRLLHLPTRPLATRQVRSRTELPAVCATDETREPHRFINYETARANNR